ncbi:MAG TPA: hypothetical protein VIF60_11940 [Burkholderiaceae bacterium]|jgi:hypothetical protein
MKRLLFSLCAILIAAPVLAQAPAASPFEQHKAKLIAHIQDRIAREQAFLSCVQAAQDHAGVKACKRASHAPH